MALSRQGTLISLVIQYWENEQINDEYALHNMAFGLDFT